MNGNTENEEQNLFQYSVKSNHTAEGYRIDCHVYGNNIDELVEEWADFQQKCLDKCEEKGWTVAPMKERKSKADIIKEHEEEMARKANKAGA